MFRLATEIEAPMVHDLPPGTGNVDAFEAVLEIVWANEIALSESAAMSVKIRFMFLCV